MGVKDLLDCGAWVRYVSPASRSIGEAEALRSVDINLSSSSADMPSPLSADFSTEKARCGRFVSSSKASSAETSDEPLLPSRICDPAVTTVKRACGLGCKGRRGRTGEKTGEASIAASRARRSLTSSTARAAIGDFRSSGSIFCGRRILNSLFGGFFFIPSDLPKTQRVLSAALLSPLLPERAESAPGLHLLGDRLAPDLHLGMLAELRHPRDLRLPPERARRGIPHGEERELRSPTWSSAEQPGLRPEHFAKRRCLLVSVCRGQPAPDWEAG